MRKRMKIFLAAMSVLLAAGGCGTRNNVYLEEAADRVTETSAEQEEATEPEMEEAGVCYVYVCGAVYHPGVYELPGDGRIYEAVEAAGGMTEEAYAESVNLAEHVTDGQMIRILTKEEVASGNPLSEETMKAAGDGRLDINRASVQDFMSLPGIGQSKAEAMVSYRDTHGAFASVEEIMNVDGIKEGVFNKIKDRIKVN